MDDNHKYMDNFHIWMDLKSVDSASLLMLMMNVWTNIMYMYWHSVTQTSKLVFKTSSAIFRLELWRVRMGPRLWMPDAQHK